MQLLSMPGATLKASHRMYPGYGSACTQPLIHLTQFLLVDGKRITRILQLRLCIQRGSQVAFKSAHLATPRMAHDEAMSQNVNEARGGLDGSI